MGKNFITMRKLHALLFLVLATTQVKGFARTKKLPSSLLENSTDTAVRCGPWGLFRDCDDKNTRTRIRLCKYRRGEAPDLSHKRADLTESDWERMENFFKTTGPKDTEEYVHQPDIQTIPCDYVEHSTPSHGTGSHYGELPRLNVSSREFDPDRSNSHKNSHNGHQDSTADFKIDHKIEEIHDINGIGGYKSTDKKIESPKVPTVDTTYSSLSKNRNKDDKKRNNGGKKRKNDDKRNKEDKKRKRGERRRKNEEKIISQKDAEDLEKIKLQSELNRIKAQKDAEELEKIKLQEQLDTLKAQKDAEELEKIKLQEQLDTLKAQKDAEELEKIKLQEQLDTLKAQKDAEELEKIKLQEQLDTLKSKKDAEELARIRLESELATLKSKKESEELARIRLESELATLKSKKDAEDLEKIKLQSELATLKAQKESEEQARIRLQEEQNRIISENQMALEEQKREFDAELERQNSELQKQLEQIRIDLERSDRERRLLEKELSEQLQIQKENDPDKILELERSRLRDEWNREQETIKRKWEESQEHLRKEMIRMQKELEEQDRIKAQKDADELEKIKLQEQLDTLKSKKESDELEKIKLQSELATLKAQKESEEQARIRLQEEQNRIISENQMALEEQKREFDAELERQNSELQKQLEQIRIDLERSDRERRLLEKELSEQLQIQKENDPDKILELERSRLRDEWNREQETIKRKWEESQEHLRKEMIRMQKELEEQDRIKAQKDADELEKIKLQEQLDTLKSKKESDELEKIKLQSELATLKAQKESEEQARIRLQEEQNRIISENQMALEEQKREFDAELERQNSELQKQLEQIRIDLERSDRERRLLEKELSEQLQIQNENEERNSSTDQTGKNELTLIPASAGGLKSEISQSDVEIKPPFGGHDFPESGLPPMKRDDSSIEFNIPPKDSVSVSDSDYNKSMNNLHLPHPKLDLKAHNTSTHHPESTENTPNHHDEKVNKVETSTAKGAEDISSDDQLAHGSKESNIDNIKSSTRLSEVSRVPTLLPPGGPLVPDPEESAVKMSESMKNSGSAEVLDSESHNTSHTPNTHNTMNTSHRVELPDSTHEEDTDTYEEEFSDDEEEFSDGNDTGQAVKLLDSTHENEGNTADDTEDAKRYEKSEELDSRVSSRPVHPHEVAAQSPEFKPTKQHDSDEPEAHGDVDGADHSDNLDDLDDTDTDDMDEPENNDMDEPENNDMDEPENNDMDEPENNDMDEPETTDGVDEFEHEAEDYYDEEENSEDENDEGNFSRGAKIAGGIIGALIAIGAAGTGYHFTSKRKAEVIELDEIDFDYAQVGDCEEVETAVLITEDVWENEA